MRIVSWKRESSHSTNVLANARFKLARRIENADGHVDLALIEKQFYAEFTRTLPKPITCGNLPDLETAITTAATLYGVLKYFVSAADDAIIDNPYQDVCESLTEYVWQKKFLINRKIELQRLQKLFSEKI